MPLDEAPRVDEAVRGVPLFGPECARPRSFERERAARKPRVVVLGCAYATAVIDRERPAVAALDEQRTRSRAYLDRDALERLVIAVADGDSEVAAACLERDDRRTRRAQPNESSSSDRRGAGSDRERPVVASRRRRDPHLVDRHVPVTEVDDDERRPGTNPRRYLNELPLDRRGCDARSRDSRHVGGGDFEVAKVRRRQERRRAPRR